MKHFMRFLALALIGVAFGFHFGTAQAAQDAYGSSSNNSSNTSLQLCGKDGNYKFALCAASVCTPTGKRIAVNTPNGGKRWFREAVCTCPVLNTTDTGGALANVNGGNMKGSCLTPDDATVWSLYSVYSTFPQPPKPTVPANPDAPWTDGKAKAQDCPASLNKGRQFANCFSFKCTVRLQKQDVVDGPPVEVADCRCPLGEDVFSALPTKPATGFFTEAGGTWENAQDACSAIPVGGF